MLTDNIKRLFFKGSIPKRVYYADLMVWERIGNGYPAHSIYLTSSDGNAVTIKLNNTSYSVPSGEWYEIGDSNLTSLTSMCYNITTLTSFIANFDTSNVTSMAYTFYYCSSLATLDLGDNWDMGNVTNVSRMFDYNYALANVTGTISNLKVSISLTNCPLTNDSAMVFINGLADTEETKTIRFKASTYNTLTEDQIAVATNKGWTVASA